MKWEVENFFIKKKHLVSRNKNEVHSLSPTQCLAMRVCALRV